MRSEYTYSRYYQLIRVMKPPDGKEHWAGWQGAQCLLFVLYAHWKRARK